MDLETKDNIKSELNDVANGAASNAADQVGSQVSKPFDHSTEVLVVGSGAGGFSTAITAASAGAKVLIIESSELIGGCSSMSGGGLWIPNNSVMREDGTEDSLEAARTYMDDVIGDVGPASSPQRRTKYLTEGPKMVDFLRQEGMEFSYTKGYPDYYPNNPGGMAAGRALEGKIFNVKELPKEWHDKLRGLSPLAMRTADATVVSKTFSRKGIARLMTIVLKRGIGGALTGKKNVGLGAALVGRLLQIALRKGVEIWRESPMTELIVEDGKVVGAVVSKEGVELRIEAKRGVILAAGGFSHNLEMREQYQKQPITTDWSTASEADHGDGIRAGITIGADTALMDDAWWGPVLMTPDKYSQFIIWERSNPFSIIVDKEGNRFMNESASYVDCGHWMYEHNDEAPCIPAYLILDSNHRKRYMIGMNPPRFTPKSALESGFISKADTLEELAQKIGVDPANLKKTVERFNGFCKTGVDEDHQRGGNAYDRYYSDAIAAGPNPNLGAIAKPPYYSINVWPGDLSTKGGLLADEEARVLDRQGKVIEGLYAVGNNSASVMGRTYPGPGASIGAAMVFGYIAGKHVSGR